MAIQDEIMALMQNPAILASLQNTMGPAGGIQSQADAAVQQQQADLAAKTQAATEASTAAGTQYQQAAAAPVSPVDPLQTFMQTLSGGIGSALTGDKGFTQRAGANLDEMHADLVRSRLDNLVALKDTYDKRAHAADLAGATEEALKSRLASDKANKAAQDILDQQRQRTLESNKATDQANALERIRVTAQEARKTAAEKPTATAGFTLKDYTDYTPSGRKYVLVQRIPDKKVQQAAYDAARKSGTPVVTEKGRSALDLVAAGRENMASIEQSLTGSTGVPFGKLEQSNNPGKIAERGLKNKISAATQSDPELRAYGAYRTAAVEAMQTIASLGVGFRINEKEIMLAIKNDIPDLWDSAATAKRKIANLKKMFLHVENAILNSPEGRDQGTGYTAPEAAPTTPAGDPWQDPELNGGG